MPLRNPRYPTKQDLALKLLREFSTEFPEIKIRCVWADALYGNKDFMTPARKLFNGVQAISQLRSNQIIKLWNYTQTVGEYFHSHPGIQMTIPIRAGEPKIVVMGGARLRVKAHKKKRFVIALRYEGESESRYIVATDMTWRMTDIV
jgi:hypothetical protein